MKIISYSGSEELWNEWWMEKSYANNQY